MLISTTNEIFGRNITKTLGTVYGVSVHSRSEVGNILGKIRAITGGKMAGYEKLVRGSIDEAVASLQEQASQAGAEAIVGFRLETASIGAGEQEEFIQVTAYGTAVKLGQPSASVS